MPLVVVVVVSLSESLFLSAHSIGIGNDPDAMSLLNALLLFFPLSLSLPPFSPVFYLISFLSVLQLILLSFSCVCAAADSFNGRNQTVIFPFLDYFLLFNRNTTQI